MLKNNFCVAVFVTLGPLGVGSLMAEGLPPVVPQGATAPQVDGRIGKAEWKGALYLGELPGELPRTEAWMQLSGTHVYIAIRCAEPTPEKMRAVTLGDEIKGKVWTDDSVEIFIDPQNLGKSIYRLVANSDGTLFDSQIVNLQQVTNGWTSNAVAQARVGRDAWEIEVAIPMATMGHRLVHGEVFSVNIGRNRFAGGEGESTSYAGPRFVYPQGFLRALAGGPIEGNGFSLVSLKRGPFVEKSGGGSWEFQIVSGEVPASLFVFPQGKGENTVRVGKRYVSIPIIAGQEEAMRECRIQQGGKELFSSSYAVQAQMKVERVTRTQKPLFEQLIEEMPEGLSKKGIVNWAHELMRPSMKVLPLRTGMEYVHEKTPFEHYRRDRTSLVISPSVLSRESDMVRQAKENGVGWMIYLKGKRPEGVPVFGKPGAKGAVWTLDPRMVASYLESAREAIRFAREDGNVRWIFAGDEMWELMHTALLRALDEKESYPELKAADQEIREKYGFGKYGLPESSSDTNPFRWIATYRWEIDQMMKMAREVRAMIDKEAPELGFISWDCMTGHRPYAVGKWAEVFDVITAQIYPAQGSGRDHAGFTSKFYSDLTGGREFWPVPHIGHYPASYTAEEVEEILSAVFRGGATGLHLYSADFHNEAVRRSGSSVVDRIGAPERWNVVRSVVDRLEKPFRVKQPKPDAAIFYSNTSYQGTGAPKTFSLNNHNEWLYTVLGPKLGMAFRFVDDLSVPAHPESLRDYRAVYVPYMPIADDAEYEALEAYAKAGGTVVICDPLSFRHRSDGSERTAGGLLPPLENTTALSGLPIVVEGEKKLASKGDRYLLKEREGKVWARYDDGKAAVLEVPYGEGRVIFFAGSPLVSGLAADAPWVAFFGKLQKSFGLEGGREVWRFRFPKAPQPGQERPDRGLCLTGNYFEWSLSEPKPMLNAQVGGSYVVRGARTPSGEPAGKPVPFGVSGKGRLTDRIAGAAAPNEAKGEDFVLSCRSEAEPWTVTFEFNAPVTARAARLFFIGRLPEGTCEVSPDGESWSPAAKWGARTAAGRAEVALEKLSLKGEGVVRFVRLNFGPTGEQRCGLVEVDLWGDE